MRYNELTEEAPHTEELDDIVSSVDEFVELIQNDCSEIIDVYRKANGNALYRGINGIRPTGNKIDYWEYRTPVDMSSNRQDMIDDVLHRQGMKAVRGNSIFTSPRMKIAKDWGSPFIVFPMNGFQYTWFKNQNKGDYMYFVFNAIIDDSLEEYRNLDDDESHNDFPTAEKFIMDQLYLMTEQYEPMNTNLEMAIEEGKEVLITGPNSYYAIPLSWEHYLPQLLA